MNTLIIQVTSSPWVMIVGRITGVISKKRMVTVCLSKLVIAGVYRYQDVMLHNIVTGDIPCTRELVTDKVRNIKYERKIDLNIN